MTMKAMFYPVAFVPNLAAATEPQATYLRVDANGALVVSGGAGGGLSAADSQNLQDVETNTGTSATHLATLAAAATDVTPAATKEDALVASLNGVNATVKQAIINISTAGQNSIVGAVAGKKFRVLSYVLVADGTVTVQWNHNVTNMTGAMALVANSGISSGYNPKGHFWTTVANETLRINLSAAVGVRGHVCYIEE